MTPFDRAINRVGVQISSVAGLNRQTMCLCATIDSPRFRLKLELQFKGRVACTETRKNSGQLSVNSLLLVRWRWFLVDGIAAEGLVFGGRDRRRSQHIL